MASPSPPPDLELVALDLSSGKMQSLIDAACRVAGAWVSHVLPCFERIFFLGSPFAPGLAFVGAQGSAMMFDPTAPSPTRFSAGGTGTSLEAALVSCLGEGLEFLSQVERDGDVGATGTVAEVSGTLDPTIAAWMRRCHHGLFAANGPSIDWRIAVEPASGRTSLVPADHCLRRSMGRRRLPLLGPLGSGCAVGRSFEHAALRALLELVERDAVALWWLGGRRGRPVAANSPVARQTSELLRQLRAGQVGALQDGRPCWLLDITTDLEVPVFAALSTDSDGRKLACGFAARRAAVDAARAAILEMAQVETAFALIATKLEEGGPAALDEVDRRHIKRGELDAAACALLHPDGVAAQWPEQEASLEKLVDRLARQGIGVWLVDLTRPDHGVAAARALAPNLQPFPSIHRSERLLSTVAICGGGDQYNAGVDIM